MSEAQRKITPADILPAQEYDFRRASLKQNLLPVKKRRRVEVGRVVLRGEEPLTLDEARKIVGRFPEFDGSYFTGLPPAQLDARATLDDGRDVFRIDCAARPRHGIYPGCP